MIEIYGKPQCPYCVKAKMECEKRQLKFEYKQLGTDFDRDFIMEMFPGARTFPQIKVRGQSVGGYDQFVEYLDNTNYNGTGHSL
jgi:glutaredoxin